MENNNNEENKNVKAEEKTEIEHLIKDDNVSDDAPKNKNSFLKRFGAKIIDEFITLGLSSLILVVVDFLMRKAGYMFTMPAVMLIIIYFIVNILYMPILESTKLKKTVGQLLFKSGSEN